MYPVRLYDRAVTNGTAADKTLELAYDAAKEILQSQDNLLGNVRTRASRMQG